MAAAASGSELSEDSAMVCLQEISSLDGHDKSKLVMTSPSSYSSLKAKQDTVQNPNTSTNEKDEMTFLIEVVKATIPKRLGKRDDKNRGMHCTATWVGPKNPSGRKRREKILHRTKTLNIDYDTDTTESMNDLIGSMDGASEVDCTEHIFTVDDSSFFLFNTSMKQLVNASINLQAQTTDNDDCTAFDNGGLRFDIFEKPLDMLNSVYSTVLADNISEKEASAITRESSSFMSYRLVGSVFLSPEEILSKCDEQRFECDLMENWRKILQQQVGSDFQRRATKKVDGGRLALRVRLASQFDRAFMKTLGESETCVNGVNVALQTTLIQSNNKKLKPAQLITEVDENVLAAESSMKAISNMSSVTQESVRYLFSNDTEKRIFVKPYPDPTRLEETTWFTEEGLHNECYKPSTNWIQAGQARSGSMGKVYLEVLECRGLPNTDAGGSLGNLTDAFVSCVYGDIMTQTEVIDDSCSPMWMPWSTRAFVFEMGHPSTDIYIGVADYDVGPLEHECIGRTTIHLQQFHADTLYTLTYNLYESSNLRERGEDMGSITVRLRIDITDEQKYLMEGRRVPEHKWVNSQQWKTHRVAKFCIDGSHDEEVFELGLFRSHINELLTQKRYLTYAIKDAISSLVYWRGQVKVGNLWLPLHSLVVYYFSIRVVERPQLLPSFLLFGFGWVMIANMLQRDSHPNPWHRGKSFGHHWHILLHGKSRNSATLIHPMQGHKDAEKMEAKWKQRIADEDEEYAKRLELDAKIKEISDDAVIRTKAKSNGALADPISAMVGPKLLPYQQRLSGYCKKTRYIRNVLNWNETIAFFFTLTLFGSGVVALFIPWGFIFLWTSRLVVWIFLGPWMRLVELFLREEAETAKEKASEKAVEVFREQRKAAKVLREQALQMKAFRVKLFGKFITRLPELNLTRHQDVPLPESSAEPYFSKEEIKTAQFVPSQDLSGAMIPVPGQDADEIRAKRKSDKETLMSKYQEMVHKKPEVFEAPEEEEVLDESFELVGTEDRVVCLLSDASGVDNQTTDVVSSEITPTSSSEQEDALSDKAIQLALEKELGVNHKQKRRSSKSKWIFSAHVSLSLRKELVEDSPATPALESSAKPAICDSSNLIEDSVQEEGVEIVPFLGSAHDRSDADQLWKLENECDHISVFYVKDETKLISDGETKSMATSDNMASEGDNKANDTLDEEENFKDAMDSIENVTANAVKRIRFRETTKINENDCVQDGNIEANGSSDSETTLLLSAATKSHQEVRDIQLLST